MKVEREGGAAAWLSGTLATPSVQGTECLPCRGYGPIRVFSSLLELAIRRRLSEALQVFLCSSTLMHLEGPLPWDPSLLFGTSGTYRGPPNGVILCRSVHQALKGAPWVGSYSEVQCLRHLMGKPLYCSAADTGMWGKRGYGDGSTPYT